MKSNLWFPWALETPLGENFDMPTITEALRHLQAAPKEVVVWILNGLATESFSQQALSQLSALEAVKARGIQRLILVSRHPLAGFAIGPIEQASGVRTYHYTDRDALHAWLKGGCKD